MTGAPSLTVERDGAVRVLTLARRELLNRFDEASHADFIQALDDVREDLDRNDHEIGAGGFPGSVSGQDLVLEEGADEVSEGSCCWL